MNEITESINICFDKFIMSAQNSWLVEIDKKHYFFPYASCVLDEKSMVVRCPSWLAVKMKVEKYIDKN